MNKRNVIIINLTSSVALDTVIGRAADELTGQRTNLGAFFILLRVEDIVTLVPWANTLATLLEETYYRTIETDHEITIERALGITHRRARNKLQQLRHEGKIANLETVHYCFGALHNNNLWLTHSGGMQAYLLHWLKRSPENEGRYRWLDVLRAPGPKGTAATEATLATTIVSGPIGKEDILVVCTPSVTDALSLERLEKIIRGNPWEGVEALLKRHLGAIGGRWIFGAILMRPMAAIAAPATSSMNSLAIKEKSASSLLIAPSIWSGKRFWQSIINLSGQRPAATAEPRDNRSTITSRQSLGWRLGQRVRWLGILFLRLIILVVLIPIRLMLSLTLAEGRKKFNTSTKSRYESAVDQLTAYLHSLPRSAQRLLIIALIFAFLFVQSLVFLAERRARANDVVANNSRLTRIQNQLDEAESNIIFHNSEQAIALLRSAEDSIGELPRRTREQRQSAELLKQSLEEIWGRLERVITVDDPSILGQVSGDAFVNPSGLLLAGEELLLYRGENNTFATIDRQTGAVAPRIVTVANVGRLRQGLIDDANRPVFLHEGQGLAVLNLGTGNLSGETIEDAPANIQAFAFYNRRLYLLDPQGRQIWRYQKIAAGYSRQRPWLKGDVENIQDGTGLTIDGSIYLLLNNGAIKKFDNGNLTDWRAQQPLTVPRNAELLQSPASSKYLYAMDRTTKRIFMWGKTDGELVAQYVFPSLNDLRDFAVDEKGQLFYVLNGNNVLKVPMAKR